MKTQQQAEANVAARAVTMCAGAVGQPMRIRISKNEVQTGTIVEASLDHTETVWRGTRLTVAAVFKIVMECGVAKVRREFLVERLPVGTANTVYR